MPKGQYKRNPPPDLTGQRFGRWTVTGRSERRTTRGAAYWWCRCDCGTVREVRAATLRGRFVSCGCYSAEVTAARTTTHGRARQPEYKTWQAMKQRCLNPKHPSYAKYGGRGITVCERWLESFESFFADMGPRLKGQSIERIDSNGNYEPGNCHWAGIVEQNRNTARNNKVRYRGRTQSVAAWAEELGMKYVTLYARLHTYGWTVHKAFTTPVGPRHN